MKSPTDVKLTPRAFCYYLQGFLEIEDSNGLTQHQLEIIKEKLGNVFENPDDVGGTTPPKVEYEPRQLLC
jgi:hypothetical protein